MRVSLLLLLLAAAVVVRASTHRNGNRAIADAVVFAGEQAFASTDPWADLLLYTAPFDASVQTQAELLAQFVIQLRLHNYRHLCDAYGKASAMAAKRLAAPPVVLLRPGTWTPTAEMAAETCRRRAPSPTLSVPQLKLLIGAVRLRDIWSSRK